MSSKKRVGLTKQLGTFLKGASCLVIVSLLASCSAISVEMQHHRLQHSVRMSDSVFLPPVEDKQKVVYVQVHNASGATNIGLHHAIARVLQNNGYRLTTHPKAAHAILQVNIKQLGKTSVAAANAALGGGFGSALSGALTGVATVAALGGTNASGYVGAGLLAGAGSYVADNLVKDVHFSLVADVQVTVKLAKGVHASTDTVSHVMQGSATKTVVHIHGNAHSVQYRTRIVATADKANLAFDTAKPVLVQSLASSIASIFGGNQDA